MYCCLLLQIHLCYLWLLLCCRVTYVHIKMYIKRETHKKREKNILTRNSLFRGLLFFQFLIREETFVRGLVFSQCLPSMAYIISWANMFHITSALIFPTFSSWGNLQEEHRLGFLQISYITYFCYCILL